MLIFLTFKDKRHGEVREWGAAISNKRARREPGVMHWVFGPVDYSFSDAGNWPESKSCPDRPSPQELTRSVAPTFFPFL